MIVIIDNYDSFTYNLVQLFQSRGAEVRVVLNDQVTIKGLKDMNPEGIILSPGPGAPEEAGICLEVVRRFYLDIPILGVCLGHQVIAEAFGSRVLGAEEIRHGKTDTIHHSGTDILKGIPQDFTATRYHSLCVDRDFLGKELRILATAPRDGVIMALGHEKYPVYGLQFHPESYATAHGPEIADNFLEIIRKQKGDEA
ncbi:MAG: hypothetical protein AVO33_06730 [delta proteobacterium ML8_F1]|nr:MAG: hypothetical protein AVO33_06730 [delta proteobacterium ML8_F1]